jgi:hypothetical protein
VVHEPVSEMTCIVDLQRFCFQADGLTVIVVAVVDVVRTDKHLEFYNEGKNSARMSDILAVYAWVDPATGYCQGSKTSLQKVVLLLCLSFSFFIHRIYVGVKVIVGIHSLLFST